MRPTILLLACAVGIGAGEEPPLKDYEKALPFKPKLFESVPKEQAEEVCCIGLGLL